MNKYLQYIATYLSTTGGTFYLISLYPATVGNSRDDLASHCTARMSCAVRRKLE